MWQRLGRLASLLAVRDPNEFTKLIPQKSQREGLAANLPEAQKQIDKVLQDIHFCVLTKAQWTVNSSVFMASASFATHTTTSRCQRVETTTTLHLQCFAGGHSESQFGTGYETALYNEAVVLT